MQMVLASDTHGRNDKLERLENEYPEAKFYLHTGDWGGNPQDYPHWTGVKGNCDFSNCDVPYTRTVEAEGHRILLIHGQQFAKARRIDGLVQLARQEGCDIVVYGHTHVPEVVHKQGVTIINPGSLARSRDGQGMSYALLNLNGPQVEAQIKRWKDLPIQA